MGNSGLKGFSGIGLPSLEPSLCNGRLTLSPTLAYHTSSLVAQSTLYWHRHKGNKVSLYKGNKWLTHEIPASPLSLSLSALPTASTCYDIFVFETAGTLSLEAIAWTSVTTRAFNLDKKDGAEVKGFSPWKKYLGTIYIDGSKQATMEFNTANSTTPTRRHVWNNYNRLSTEAKHISTASHTYASATFRKWNNTDELRHEIVIGLQEESVHVFFGGNQHTNATIDVAPNWVSGGGSFLDWYNSSTSGISAFSGGGITPPLGMSTWDVVESATSGTATFATCVLNIIVWN